uniref:probable disease resistance protein At5g66910 n=1 Tax=Fragaria vesca subsp. vesca TaxID=101020 RepID=UPI0005CAEFF4|nr:PREDICTED: probable disease resistance protein At5g66910 [Fragaria vesca subsp. vesca]XP_011460515.1 PREDICTED: probable disease resistance protein At5g66910 [Fragaria vesca subsp. vesca]
MWAELYDLDDDIVFAYVHELCNRNLATLVDERYLKIEGDDYYGGRFVTQHDLLSELAIYNAKLNPLEQRKRMIVEIGGDNIPKWWKEQKYQPTKARLLSIRTDEEFSMKWPQFQLPEAEVLVLDLDGYMYALPEFVEKMHKLKVAVIVARSHICRLENLELLQLLPNLKRISLYKIPINSMRKNPIQFKSLKKVSLSSCHPKACCSKGVGKMSDAFPNLEELNIDNCKEPEELLGDFCNVIYLKKISIFDCDDLLRLPKEIGNLVNLEVLRPRECTEVLKFTGSVRK